MMDMPLYLAEFPTTDKLLQERGPEVYPAGLSDQDKAYVKYGPKSSNQPSLIIVEPIYDKDRNAILPGYYELALSEDRRTLLLTQSQKLVATIPVFRLHDNRPKNELAQPMDNKTQRKFDKKAKKAEKKKKKDLKKGKYLTEPDIYNNASIEYDIEGDYYLIKYERDYIEAWGALKKEY